MAARLATPAARIPHKRRSALVEPGLAQLFQQSGRRLHLRGHDAVDTETELLGTVRDMNKDLPSEKPDPLDG
ncbi:hypothetical protein SAMN05216371_8302 [Streptomyces sp. TLI_053]|uniref:hypothetical protein n=1 Tax=Streptomyces sp. TLI_053 TaxID=1855352 RepID=UPI00087A4BC1|nr:hypothetical protein [Streptomyces sp. TLI_053]SDT83469.1 hypothetical protein SAMN05216371_8302 [Streptomyces sp. TLI_053]